MFGEFLMIGGVFFWIGVAVVALALTIQVHNERQGWAALTLIGTIAAVVLLTNAPAALADVRPIYYLYAALAYLALAAIWAAIKWRCFFLPALFRKYSDMRAAWLARKGLKEMPTDPTLINEFKNTDVKYLNIDTKRMVSHNKGRITTWMIFWPFSLLETFVGDFLANVFENIYRRISGMLQRMSDSMASKYSELN